MSSKGKAKAIAAPAPAVVADTSTAVAAGEDAAKAAAKKQGYQKSVLTGSLTPKSTGKKTVLG